MAGVRGVPDDLVTWLEELKPRFKEALEEQGKVVPPFGFCACQLLLVQLPLHSV